MAGQSALGQGALTKATLVGTLLQVAMVVLGHFMPAIQSSYPIVGSLIAAFTGLMFSKGAMRPARMASASGGAIAGGVSGFLGSGLSAIMGDVPGPTIGVATIASVIAGLAGGAIGHRK
ncbi:MAG TPA: hypothetical protein VFS94_07600 [Gemmatimonadales bacterium]|nr:hypothetical protein [Gemmatimonadales bacterium]